MEIAQHGVCYICKREKPLNVDHCHRTGKVRKLLCAGCNTGLAILENLDHLARLQAYLLEHAFADVPSLARPQKRLRREYRRLRA